jgi:hypothetical protein
MLIIGPTNNLKNLKISNYKIMYYKYTNLFLINNDLFLFFLIYFYKPTEPPNISVKKIVYHITFGSSSAGF